MNFESQILFNTAFKKFKDKPQLSKKLIGGILFVGFINPNIIELLILFYSDESKYFHQHQIKREL